MLLSCTMPCNTLCGHRIYAHPVKSNNDIWFDCGISPNNFRSSIRSITVLLTFGLSRKSSLDKKFSPVLHPSTPHLPPYLPVRQWCPSGHQFSHPRSEISVPWQYKDQWVRNSNPLAYISWTIRISFRVSCSFRCLESPFCGISAI